MSIHLLTTTDPTGHAVEVRLGWDRPLQGFHLTITSSPAGSGAGREHNADADDAWDDENGGGYGSGVLYSNVSDPDLLSSWGTTTPPDIDPFLERLAALGIALPQAMLDACLEDQATNAGNRIVRYTPDGASIDPSLAPAERPRG